MKISKQISFPGTVEQVFAMLTDEKFQAAKAVAEHTTSHDEKVTATPDGGAITLVHRSISTERMPGMVKSMIGPAIELAETYTWGPAAADGSRTGDLEVTMKKVPLVLKAKTVLAPSGSGATKTVEGVMEAKMFMGGQVEKMAQPWLLKGLDVEAEMASDWLAEHGS